MAHIMAVGRVHVETTNQNFLYLPRIGLPSCNHRPFSPGWVLLDARGNAGHRSLECDHSGLPPYHLGLRNNPVPIRLSSMIPHEPFFSFQSKKTNDNVNPKPSTLGIFTPFPQGLPSWCRGCVGWQVAWITWNFNYNVNCPDFRCQACILDLSSDYSQFKIGCWTYVCAFQIIDAWLHIVIYDYIPRGSMYGIFTYIDP
jgi:hypothetical protein